MAGNFKKGDVVKLKSGSPPMTIQDIGDYSHRGAEDGALCVWFDKFEKKESVFDLDSLSLHKEREG